MTTEERFWDKIITGYGGECWEFPSVDGTGYGQFYLRKEGRKSINVHAHRFAWELTNGPIPDGLHVCHKCDRKSCVRPDHLFLGTHKENIQDAWQKGRVDRGPKWYAANLVAQKHRREKGTSTWVRGEDVGNHKLSEEEVLKIREMEGSAPSTEIAPLFGLHSSTVRNIWHRKIWAHLALVVACLLSACARTDIYWPPNGKDVVVDEKGRVKRHHNRAIVLNGSDALGATHVKLAGNTLEFSTQGGIDNSTSTKEGYRTVRFGIAAAAWAAGATAVASQAASAYGANQGAAATSNVAASRAASAAAVSKNATTVKLAEIAAAREAAAAAAGRAPAVIPAAGSTIPSIIPSTVVPVVTP